MPTDDDYEAMRVGLWQDPARMAGEVCLRGTRIPADQIALYIEEMREDWGVTLEQMISVYRWDEAGRPAVIGSDSPLAT
jgi:uncharacterized protein (DUF433 family)